MDKRNFAIDIETGDTTVMHKDLGSFKTYVVQANGFPIATFVDPSSMKAYVDCLKREGIAHLPDKIINHLRDLSYLRRLGGTPGSIIKPIS